MDMGMNVRCNKMQLNVRCVYVFCGSSGNSSSDDDA